MYTGLSKKFWTFSKNFGPFNKILYPFKKFWTNFLLWVINNYNYNVIMKGIRLIRGQPP